MEFSAENSFQVPPEGIGSAHPFERLFWSVSPKYQLFRIRLAGSVGSDIAFTHITRNQRTVSPLIRALQRYGYAYHIEEYAATWVVGIPARTRLQGRHSLGGFRGESGPK